MSEARLRVLIVDDEQPARERLRRLLGELDHLEIIGEAEDGEQAIERIIDYRPDVVLLDVQMPGCSGLEVAASLPSPRPGIIFCTAYDEYAVQAFELHAVDYLLKPVNRVRLSKALDRVAQARGSGSIDGVEGKLAGSFPSRYLARHKARFCVVPSGEVLYFSSDGGQTKLQTAEGHYWMQPTLLELEQRLDPDQFFRISRATIVNLNSVREVLPISGGQGKAKLVDGTEIEISRRRFKELMERLSES